MKDRTLTTSIPAFLCLLYILLFLSLLLLLPIFFNSEAEQLLFFHTLSFNEPSLT